MTPAARVQAAIEILGPVLRGEAAERALTRWARASRFAGSGDRAAVRDHVFDALRRLRSAAWAGGLGDADPVAMEARAVMRGLLVGQGADADALFDGSRHGPARWDGPDTPAAAPPRAVRLDVPDWTLRLFDAALGPRADAVCLALRDRAPVHLRANAARTDRDGVVAALRDDGYDAHPHPAASTAVEVRGAPRGLQAHALFRDGLFEFQDAGSQALVEALPLVDGMRVLDLCAGGGGKALAMAARSDLHVTAHDADPARMRDLPERARRARAPIAVELDPRGPFDLVVCDVPCSGSGSWRRAPEAKWRLTPDALDALMATQAAILDRADALAGPRGAIAYMTCSLFTAENGVAAGAVGRLGRRATGAVTLTPLDGTDGFHMTQLGPRTDA
ncbi:RsmB/NOP family class I SAM-dependent RNA methyltransferase [Jannaschia sp. LMIT008]|uniref:RsmB/NOP family class I SAM-dependent RNA methyltransferase n=1 Tax=Jannaschia maritima TaxID=3032585 RepID=UPI002811C1F1|nr:RsmB/NOP family class I SAM-dependent RNA methyltransferase [Jannaschia sp. LMIT008]